jgi:hypothetical protein
LLPRSSRRILSKLKAFAIGKRGQVSERDELGRWIRHLSSLDESGIIVEIGTWNGLGTSKMIAEGVRSRTSYQGVKVIGLEANYNLYCQAKKNLAKHEFYETIWGTLVKSDQLDHANLNEVEKSWLAQDLVDLEKTPFVLDRIPGAIDLLVLDGGEFSTYAEFQILQSRVTRWIVLDDTKTRKCRRILEEISSYEHFSIVWSSSERNGTAILCRASKD